MEIEKVVRILTVFLLGLVLALVVATRLMFPEAPNRLMLPIVLLLPAMAAFRKDAARSDRGGSAKEPPQR